MTSSDTFSYFFIGICMTHRLWVSDYFIVYIFTLGADLGSLNRCYANLKWNHLLWIISKNVGISKNVDI